MFSFNRVTALDVINMVTGEKLFEPRQLISNNVAFWQE